QRRTPFSLQQTRVATSSTFEPVTPASTSSLAVPPTGPACALAAIAAKAKAATEAGNQDFRAMMISLLWDVSWVGEEHASCVPTRPIPTLRRRSSTTRKNQAKKY